MPRFLTLLLLVLICVVANAQVRLTLNYNKDWRLTTPDSAKFIRVGIYDTTKHCFAGPVIDLYRSGKTQMKGVYKLRKKEGEFTSYYENGNVESTGMFQDDVRAGVWKYYYSDGGMKMEIEFRPGGEFPKVMTLNDPSGKHLIENGSGDWSEDVVLDDGGKVEIYGNYKDSVRHGHWKFIGPGNGRLDEWYKDGAFVDGQASMNGVKSKVSLTASHDYFSLPLPSKFAVTERFEAEPWLDMEKIYPALTILPPGSIQVGDKVYMVVERQPEPIGGLANLYKFMSKNTKYPVEARHKGISGNVFVQFDVEGDGSTTNYQVVQSIGGGCDEEAVRVLNLFAKEFGWLPGKQQGKPVRVRFVLPVKFPSSR